VIIFLFFNSTGFKKNVFLEKSIFTFEHGAKVFCDSVTSFLMFAKGALVLNDSGDFDVMLFGHIFILFVFVMIVKLFFEVCANFFGTCRAQVIQKKLSEFFVMAHNGLIAFDANDAEATRSDFPDLAFLW
jgi:hypothetical protein